MQKCFFWGIALVYNFIGLNQFLEVKSGTRPNQFFLASMGLIPHSETILLSTAPCKIFWGIVLIYDFVGLSQLSIIGFFLHFRVFIWLNVQVKYLFKCNSCTCVTFIFSGLCSKLYRSNQNINFGRILTSLTILLDFVFPIFKWNFITLNKERPMGSGAEP